MTTRTMTTVATFGPGYKIVEDPRWHDDPSEYLRYDLIDSEGDEVDSSDNLDVLSGYARELAQELAEELEADRVAELKTDLETLAWDCDDAGRLEAAIKALKGE